MASYFALVLNLPFIVKTYLSAPSGTTLFFFVALVCYLGALFISLFSLCSIKFLEKPFYILMTLMSSILSYSYVYYGTIFNGHSPVMGTLSATNWQEFVAFCTPSFLVCFIVFGIIPSILIYKIRIVRPQFLKEVAIKVLGVCVYPGFYLITALPSLPDYHALICETGLAARAPFQIVPTNFIEDVFNLVKERMMSHIPYRAVGLDATYEAQHLNGKKNLLVFVVGETARSMNFALNGYARDTNPYTSKQGVISFQKMSSCGTSTRISLPCMFSSVTRQDFFEMLAEHQDNLLDILKRAGLNVLWIDNNGANDCQGVCKRVDTIVLHGLDDIVVKEFRGQLDKLRGKDAVVVLHLHGSHGPDYYDKYPPEFQKFKPDCQQDDFRFCHREAIVNAYDNTILYSDFVLSEIINVLKQQTLFWNSALLYTSDHGESLGEQGLYEHCTPYVIAPIEQTMVPLIVWFSKSFQSEKQLSVSCMTHQSRQKSYSHDNLFHSILGVMDIKTSIYQEQLDIFKDCRLNTSMGSVS